MCGIIGIVGKTDGNIGSHLLSALKRLEYRGYDSVGIATLDNGIITIKKEKGKIVEVCEVINFDASIGNVGIGHTRWATHGIPSYLNSHPHFDQDKEIAVVHNGIVENFQELKQLLQDEGYEFKSDTDTEVIPHLIAYLYKKNNDFQQAVIECCRMIEGGFGLAIISTHTPDTIWCIKRDNPLLLGIGDNVSFCASDAPALLPYTNRVVYLKENMLARITASSYHVIDIITGNPVKLNPKTIHLKSESAEKSGFPHFMLKEIHEQSNAITQFLRNERVSIRKFIPYLKSADNVFFIGAGSAYYSTLFGNASIIRNLKIPSISIIASEYEAYLPLINEKTVVLVFSQSGETLDTIKAIKAFEERGAILLGFLNTLGSTIARIVKEVTYLLAGPEIGVAATKTYLLMSMAVCVLDYELSVEVNSLSSKELDIYSQSMDKLSEHCNYVVNSLSHLIQDVAKKISKCSSMFFLGRGSGLQSALEGALKLKEIAYIHSEAYPSGESKHGPIALIEEGFPVCVIVLRDEDHNKSISNIMEMKARGAYIIAVCEEGDEKVSEVSDDCFFIPQGYSRYFSTIPWVIPLQLLSYYVALDRGVDIDKPRNLAKSVTVL